MVTSVHYWAILSNNFNLVFLLCLSCVVFFFFLTYPVPEFSWCFLVCIIILIMALAKQR